MKLKYAIEIHPAVLLLIVLAIFGCDAFWTQQRKHKRVTSQPAARPGASSRMPPMSPFGPRPVPPTEEPISPGEVTVERDAPKSPFSRHRSSSASAHERAQARIKQYGQDASQAFTNGVNAYVRQQQPQQQ